MSEKPLKTVSYARKTTQKINKYPYGFLHNYMSGSRNT
jgi:hypothetical protein